ncbi:AAA family ATPase [Parabacteroides sp. APC149_11_2_Y6]
MTEIHLDTLFLDITSDQDEERPILKQDDVTVFSRDAMSLITGKAKSRKTFFLSAIVAALAKKNEILTLKRCSPVKTLWIDTEQSIFHFHQSVARAYEMANISIMQNCEDIIPLSFSILSTEQRVEKLKDAVEEYRPDVIIIDGIRDFVYDINDVKESSRLKDLLMWIHHQYDCHICSVLHQNKGDSNARGHLGSELTNKSETVFSLEPIANTTKVIPACCRNMPFNQFSFEISDETGLPIICKGSTKMTRDKKLIPALEELFDEGKTYKYSELIPILQVKLGIKMSTAEANLRYALKVRLVYKDEEGIYHLNNA